MRRFWLCLLIGLAAGLAVGGCRHHCGYLEVEMRVTPAGENDRVELEPALVLLTNSPSAQDVAVAVKVAGFAREWRGVRREFTGRQVYTRYHWSVPFKILLPISLPMGLILSWRQPHCHDAMPWSLGDYGRDVLGWINPFEAWPGGKQYVADERAVFRRDLAHETAGRRLLPVENGRVALYCAGKQITEGVTDADGVCRFDLRRLMSQMQLSQAFSLDVLYRPADGSPHSRAVEVSAETAAEWARATSQKK